MIRIAILGSWFKVQGSWLRVNGLFRVHGSRLLPTYMAYEKKDYKKRIEGCHNL